MSEIGKLLSKMQGQGLELEFLLFRSQEDFADFWNSVDHSEERRAPVKWEEITVFGKPIYCDPDIGVPCIAVFDGQDVEIESL